MSVTYQQAAPIATAGAQSFVMPDMFGSPGLTMIAPQQQSIVYAAPTQTLSYAQPTQYTYAAAEPAGSVTYAAPTMTYAAAEPAGSVTYAAPTMTYAAAPAEMTYAAPQMYAAPPAGGQPVYTISPERFQLILQGQPLTNEEIAAMTGQPQAAAQIATQIQGAESFVMPDMFASPGLTMVGGNPGAFNAAPATASMVASTATASAEPAMAAAVSLPDAAVAPPSASAKKSDKKKSDKKSSKAKASSKKKSKGCC